MRMETIGALVLLALGAAATAAGIYAMSTVHLLRRKADETGSPPSWDGIGLLMRARQLEMTAGLLLGAGIGQFIVAVVLLLADL